MKKQQLFKREEKTEQTNWLQDRQTGKYRKSQFTRAEICKQEPPWEPMLGKENMNYN